MAFNVKEAAAERHLIMAKAARGGTPRPNVQPKPDSRIMGITGGVMAPGPMRASRPMTGRPAR